MGNTVKHEATYTHQESCPLRSTWNHPDLDWSNCTCHYEHTPSTRSASKPGKRDDSHYPDTSDALAGKTLANAEELKTIFNDRSDRAVNLDLFATPSFLDWPASKD